MFLYFSSELLQLAHDIEQLWVPALRGVSDEAKFMRIKGRVLEILKLLYGESSREFRVVQLTCSPATVVKVVNHVLSRSTLDTPYTTKAVSM